MVDKDWVALHRARYVGANAGRIGVHAHDPALHCLGVVAQEDGIVQALAHLGLAVGADERAAFHKGIGQREDLAVGIVESPRNLARQLDVTLVVLAHRHQVGARHENIRRLQDRIAEQVVRDLVHAGRGGHVLDRRQLLQALDRNQAAEQQLQLVDLVHRRLKVEGDLVRVDTDGQVVEHDDACDLGDVLDALLVGLRRQHVQVGDQEEALVLLLKLEPVAVAADIVPEM